MTKIIVQHFVENLLKKLKVLKTRTALTRNGLAELRVRYARQGAKAPSKQRSETSNNVALATKYKQKRCTNNEA